MITTSNASTKYNTMGKYIEMIEFSEVVHHPKVFMVEHQTLFDRRHYKDFIKDFPHDATGRSFNWVIIAGMQHAYRITNHNELIHVLAYVYNALIRDPSAITVKVPALPPQSPNEVAIDTK